VVHYFWYDLSSITGIKYNILIRKPNRMPIKRNRLQSFVIRIIRCDGSLKSCWVITWPWLEWIIAYVVKQEARKNAINKKIYKIKVDFLAWRYIEPSKRLRRK